MTVEWRQKSRTGAPPPRRGPVTGTVKTSIKRTPGLFTVQCFLVPQPEKALKLTQLFQQACRMLMQKMMCKEA